MRSTSPFVPKPATGFPSRASSAKRRQRELMNTRRSLPFVHVATPRCTNPVPLDGCPYPFHGCGSNSQYGVPVVASIAMTRLNGVGKINVSLMASGVAWNVPGRAGFWPSLAGISCSFASQVHTTLSSFTFLPLMSASGEYFCAPASPPHALQSTPRDAGGALRRDWAPAVAVSGRSPAIAIMTTVTTVWAHAQRVCIAACCARPPPAARARGTPSRARTIPGAGVRLHAGRDCDKPRLPGLECPLA